MDFEGLVYKVLPAVKGTSTRGEWTKQEMILELPGEFSRKLCVSFWGDKTRELENIKEGEAIGISANVESKEFNGRWFTEVRAWRVMRKTAGQQPQGDAAAAPSTMHDFPAYSTDTLPGGDDKEVDDLPF
ncbi:hypothetical protein FACS1894159_06530 [Bacteroidia bacterium]|nr:hypothetical protein FACS1894159_06530 [Bacteroidia bacterium]